MTGQLGHKYADELYAIYIGSALKLTPFNGDLAWNIASSQPLPEDLPPTIRDSIIAVQKRFAVHLAAHMLDPSTLAYGLADSPAGMLAWMLKRWDN